MFEIERSKLACKIKVMRKLGTFQKIQLNFSKF